MQRCVFEVRSHISGQGFRFLLPWISRTVYAVYTQLVLIAGFCSTAGTWDPFLHFLGEKCDTCLWRGDVKTSGLTRVGESTVRELVLGKEYYLFTPLLHNRLSV